MHRRSDDEVVCPADGAKKVRHTSIFPNVGVGLTDLDFPLSAWIRAVAVAGENPEPHGSRGF